MKTVFLSHFTPSLMKPEELEALFVQREALAQRLVELIQESALTLSKYHSLLVGQHGIGKTHLVALLYHRVRVMEDLHDRLRIAWLREEEWGVSSLLDLFLRIFRALQAEYPEEFPAERIHLLYALPPAEAECFAGTLLKECIGDRTLLLLAENLDDIFKGLEDKGQRRLRAYLQEKRFCTILATSQSLFSGISLHTSPFYGFFQVHHLREFSLDDAVQLLLNAAKLKEDPDLVSFIQTPIGRARIRALHHLAGGNPRVYIIFANFLTRDSLDDLVEPFMHVLDELTPYYQSRIALLSNQQRKIVEFLCDYGGAVPVKEIAKHCFLSQQATSAQLKELREKGYVIGTPLESDRREVYYELREPLMRICIDVKKNRGEPTRGLVDFLRFWYKIDEPKRCLASLPTDSESDSSPLARIKAIARRYEETKDERILLSLPVAEREIVKEALSRAEAQNAEGKGE